MLAATVCATHSPAARSRAGARSGAGARASTASWLALALALVSAGCGEPPPVGPPSILLVTLDTLRADHVGAYGYARPTTPVLDAFAGGATLFERAKSPASWTLPAHASLFTGLYPPEHGAQMVARVPGARPRRDFPLHPELTTLAEVLGRGGYATAAVCANFIYLSERYRLNRGFQHWETLPGELEVSAAPASRVNERALAWLASRPSGPFLLFLNYMDTHTPYNTTPHPEFPGYPIRPFARALRERHERIVMGTPERVPRRVLEVTRDQYDLALRNLDTALGELFGALRAEGLYDDLLIVITSDHGEYLGERGLLGHAKDVYEGTLAVPLLVKLPRQRRGAREGRPISLVHLPDRILVWAGLRDRVPPGQFPNRWPAPVLFAENRYSLWVDLAKPWGQRFDRIRQALYDDAGMKFIHSSDGEHALYALDADPEERDDLLGDDPALLEAWTARLEASRPARITREPAPEAEPLSEAERAGLRALGYAE